MRMSKQIHTPTTEEIEKTRLAAFVRHVQKVTGGDFGDFNTDGYLALHRWSVENLGLFHDCVWDFCGILGDKGDIAVSDERDILKAVFFPNGKISFAENMLKRAETRPKEPAIISRTTGREDDRILSWKQLYDAVSLWEQALERLGVGEGDRVATYLPHAPEAYIIMIAAAQRGAIFSSVGTEMGAQSTIARFQQIEPKVLIAADGYTHMKAEDQPGKPEDRIGLIADLQAGLPSLERTVVVANLHETPNLSALKNSVLGDDILDGLSPKYLEFKRRGFNTPLAILFSSGSTGKPKCFVHGVGGTILKHAIEHQLQSDVYQGDRLFFHSTTSWMMFNWLASGLAQGATIMVYDGNPAYPGPDSHLQFAADYGCTHLGTAAAIVQDVWAKNAVNAKALDLSKLRSLIYTGSVLSDEGFDYVDQSIKKGLSIEGMCGGTDFVGAYTTKNAFMPTIAGQQKGPVLGMDVDVWREDGSPAPIGEVGELVVKNPFASRPLYFWNDPDGERFTTEYFKYFDTNPAVWRHGDAVKKALGGQFVIEGRSDTTLNQGGVRIGTQQLYDALVDVEGISDSLAANFKDSKGGDHSVLFVVLDGVELDEALYKNIKTVISDSVGRLSCPHEILLVPYVLKTPNGKKAEKPTAAALAGKEVSSPETYGYSEKGELKVNLFAELGENLRQNPVYGFVEAVAGQN